MLGTRSTAPENTRRRRVTTLKDVLRHISRSHEPDLVESDEGAADPVDVLVRILAPMYNMDPNEMAVVARTNEETSNGTPTYDVLLQHYTASGTLKTLVDVSNNFLRANIEANLGGPRGVAREGLIKIGAVLTGIESVETALWVASTLDRRRITFTRKVAMMGELCKSLRAQNPGIRFFAGIDPVVLPRRKK